MGTAERRNREKKRREEDILDAAEKVFFGKGFDNSTMDDVAAEAELSKGALYKYFTSKNELCTGIVSRSMRIIIEYFEEASVSGTCSGLERLKQICLSFLDFYRKNPKYYCALQNYRHHRSGCGAESVVLKDTIEENVRINAILEAAVRDGISDMSVNPMSDPSKSAAMLWGDVNGIIPACVLSSQNEEGEAVFKFTIETVIKGLENKGGKR